jgi:cysteine desulfurase
VPDRPVYLDNHATTRTDPRVVEAMLPFFTTAYGNPSSAGHRFGWEAAEAVERAREQVAALIGAEPREVVFTSGATEANNLALKGVLPALASRGNHVVTSAVEHRSVLDTLKRLGRSGWELTVVAPDPHGEVTPAAIAAALTDRTVLVSVIAASNEVGTINDLAGIGRLCQEHGAVFHTDAVQAVGKIPLDVAECRANLLSLSGHKLHGPKGIGALYVRRRGPPAVRLTPVFDGGGQERGLRSGTVPVPLVVGLGAACAIAAREREAEAARLETLRGRLHAGIVACIDGVRWNGHPTRRLPGNLNLSFAGVDGEALMMGMREVAVSSGAACTSGQPEPSHVLLAMGLDEAAARASLRFGLGRFTTEREVDFAAAYVAAVVRRLRGDSGTSTADPGGRGFDDLV